MIPPETDGEFPRFQPRRASSKLFCATKCVIADTRERSPPAFLWEFGCPVGIAKEAAADGEIKQHVEFLIKWCGEFAAVGFPFGLSLCQLAIDVPTNGPLFPFQREDVEVVVNLPF